MKTVQITMYLLGTLQMTTLSIDVDHKSVFINDECLGTIEVSLGNEHSLPMVREHDLLKLVRSKYPKSEPAVYTTSAVGLKVISKGSRVIVMDDGFLDDH